MNDRLTCHSKLILLQNEVIRKAQSLYATSIKLIYAYFLLPQLFVHALNEFLYWLLTHVIKLHFTEFTSHLLRGRDNCQD